MAPGLVSIVMCTYNGEQFVDEQIASVLQQDYANTELIIVDDCSADSTWNKLLQWQTKSSKIKIFRNDINLGYNKNFEKAIRLAAGNFIALSDQDDIWLPQKISKLLNAFTEAQIVLAHCRSVVLENEKLNFKRAKLQHHFSGNDTRKLFFFNQIMGHDMLFRKELTKKFLPIPEGMSYDWWIAVCATCYGSVASVNEYLVYHRMHAENSYFSKTAPSKKRELGLDETLKLFGTIRGMKQEYKDYLDKFSKLISGKMKRNSSAFDIELFRFLYKHRKIIFGHKRRKFPELSYIKNAIKYTRMNYNGRGITF